MCEVLRLYVLVTTLVAGLALRSPMGSPMHASRARQLSAQPQSRRDALSSALIWGCSVVLGGVEGAWAAELSNPGVGKMTKSGIKYFDLKEGEGQEPSWGQLLSIKFTFFGRPSSDDRLEKIDSSDNNGDRYLFKHGNGRQIKGLEEGVHSMKVGGKRRIIVQPNMGYTVAGLGPYPAHFWDRKKLIKLLDGMTNTGELVFDVELCDAFADDADLGYYQDESLTVDQVEEVIRVTDALLGGKGSLQALPGEAPQSQLGD
ncbi:unnamed protein product [Chrysoparadoxa australica]